jgi:hypothetical protein
VGSSSLDRFGQRILDLEEIVEAGSTSELEQAGRGLAQLLFA